MISVLILILAGCGGGGNSGNAGSSGPVTGTDDGATAQTKAESRSTSEGAKTEETSDTGSVSGGDAGLDTPVLGDSGAPVVMVEYSDYQ